MGYRTFSYQLSEPDNPAVFVFLEQMAEFGEFHGCRPGIEKLGSAADDGWVVFSLDANSMWLNDFTPVMIRGCHEIAADVDPDSSLLRRLVSEIESQLQAQLVIPIGDGFVTLARPTRENLERIEGEASPKPMADELTLHISRLESRIESLASVSGVDAWHQRAKLRWEAAIDAEAVIRIARRFERLGRDTCALLPGHHLENAYKKFMAATEGLIDLRDMAEHVDEYAVGRGRKDQDEQPGPVFKYLIVEEDVVVSARGKSLSVLSAADEALRLGRCLEASTQARWSQLVFPSGLDLDFVIETEEGELLYVDRDKETEEQSELRRALNAHRFAPADQEKQPELGSCPECGEDL